MKKSRFTDSQIMAALKRVKAGLPVPERAGNWAPSQAAGSWARSGAVIVLS